MASKKLKVPKTKPAKNYRHPESESSMRPEVGTQWLKLEQPDS
jgi:hypothetical protein